MYRFKLGRFCCVPSILAAAIVATAPARAADMPAPAAKIQSPATDPWIFEAAPYLWAAGLKGKVDLGPAAPLTSVDVGFDDVLKHMKMGFMGIFEARKGEWGFIADIAYLSVAVDATGPAGFVNGTLKDQTFFATFAGAYRFVHQPTFWVDAIVGVRPWWKSTTLNITAPGPVALSVTRDQGWVDPIVGLRARAYATPSIYVQLYGDAGGFGVGAKSDWQAAALLGYQYSKTTSFFAGYRYLAVDYNRDGYLFDVRMSGPIMGASMAF